MIYGITGYARTGKDTISQVFVEAGFKVIKAADPVRDAVYTLNPFIHGEMRLQDVLAMLDPDPVAAYEAVKSTEFGPEVRRLLQTMGTNVGREQIDPDVWANTLIRKAGNDDVVVPDVRFLNEANVIRQAGGKIIRVKRPGFGPLNDHPSETELDLIEPDYLIVNEGSVEMLHEMVGEILCANSLR